MSDELREVARSGIRCRHAAYSEQDVELALRRLTLGDALFTAAFPGMPLLAP
ncbi:MAG: hypothetical protein U1F43_27985 [Myxococcota bacterium]